jgi:hypothetical protein
LELEFQRPDLISAPLWKTPLFYAGSNKIAREKGHYYKLNLKVGFQNGPLTRIRRVNGIGLAANFFNEFSAHGLHVRAVSRRNPIIFNRRISV